MTFQNKFEGCILGGAIGDAWGSSFENQTPTTEDSDMFYLFGKPEPPTPKWRITDDTQLTLATIEAIQAADSLTPKILSEYLLQYFREGKLSGIGASTLKALQELHVGGHWSQVGRKGEFAAGNGAAMRIAPIAFLNGITPDRIRDFSIITHNNDEAYIGARCVVIAIQAILDETWKGDTNLISIIIQQIPDTRVRDRLIEVQYLSNLKAIGEFGNDGYVVNSIPLAIAAANQVLVSGMENMFSGLIEIGGDTDTNCSIAGQIAGTLLGRDGIPPTLLQKLEALPEYSWIKRVISKIEFN